MHCNSFKTLFPPSFPHLHLSSHLQKTSLPFSCDLVFFPAIICSLHVSCKRSQATLKLVCLIFVVNYSLKVSSFNSRIGSEPVLAPSSPRALRAIGINAGLIPSRAQRPGRLQPPWPPTSLASSPAMAMPVQPALPWEVSKG